VTVFNVVRIHLRLVQSGADGQRLSGKGLKLDGLATAVQFPHAKSRICPIFQLSLSQKTRPTTFSLRQWTNESDTTALSIHTILASRHRPKTTVNLFQGRDAATSSQRRYTMGNTIKTRVVNSKKDFFTNPGQIWRLQATTRPGHKNHEFASHAVAILRLRVVKVGPQPKK
jgi:hypothetical protein